MNQKKRSPLRLRLIQIFLGAVVLLWLSVEDTSLLPVYGFAAMTAILTAISIAYRFRPDIGGASWWMPLLGAGTGLGVPFLAIAFMILKMGLHSHAAPDYSPEQILHAVQSIPVWVLGGSLVGAGLSLGRYALRR